MASENNELLASLASVLKNLFTPLQYRPNSHSSFFATLLDNTAHICTRIKQIITPILKQKQTNKQKRV
jgi:hypothetical protein